jgi:hypothetical protein
MPNVIKEITGLVAMVAATAAFLALHVYMVVL